MTSTLSKPISELTTLTNTIGQAVQASTSSLRFFRSFKPDTRAGLVLLISVCGLVWALTYFIDKR
jgi:hypothetical protein